MDMDKEFERVMNAIGSSDYTVATRDDVQASVGLNKELLRMKVM